MNEAAFVLQDQVSTAEKIDQSLYFVDKHQLAAASTGT